MRESRLQAPPRHSSRHETGRREAVPPGRDDEVAELLDAIRLWAHGRADLRAVALVGSWARGNPHADSDVDIVLLTDTPQTYIDDAGWARRFGAVEVLRTQRWGVLTERRMLVGGLLVEFGVVEPAWASTSPLDDGTAQAVADGLVALHDPTGLLSRLVAAVAAQRA